HLAIFEAFYADDIEVSIDTQEEVIRGKPRVRALLYNFLFPLHVMAEIFCLQVSIRQTSIPGDGSDQECSEWTLELVGMSGRARTLSWRALRKWNGLRVVYEHHYDLQRSGEPLTEADLSFEATKPAPGEGNDR